jgi:H+-transporting ATPase
LNLETAPSLTASLTVPSFVPRGRTSMDAAPGLSVINSAIDEARRIFGRITSYTLDRVALTTDIMFLVVLSTVFLGFAPLTAAMIVIMSLLDDVPIMTIAYDNTAVSSSPIRWRMPRILGVSGVLGLFSVVESFGLLLIGLRVLCNRTCKHTSVLRHTINCKR